MKEESDKFIGYENKYGYTVAVFKPAFLLLGGNGKVKETFGLIKSDCKLRLENLQKGGCAHDQTLLALKHWPKDE